MKAHLEAYGPGASGYVFGEITTNGLAGHYYRWAVLEDGLHILEGQPVCSGIDWSGDAEIFLNVFKRYDPDAMYVTNDIRHGLFDGSIVPNVDLISELVRERK